MKCPKCGYERQSRDDAFVPITECPACGIVYSKHDYIKVPESADGIPQPPHLKTSPIDPASLKKARERVDKRLREKLETRIHDERHAQTLELAKRLTAEQVRKRTAERRQTPKTQPQEASREAEMRLKPKIEAEITEGTPVMPSPTEVEMPQGSGTEQAAENELSSEQMVIADTLNTQSETIQAAPETEAQTESVAVATDDADAGKPHEVTAEAEATEEEAVLLEDIVVVSADRPQEEPQNASAATDDGDEVTETPTPMENTASATGPGRPEAHVAATASRHASQSCRSAGPVRILPLVAWMILAAGVIGAVLSWTTIGNAQAGVRIPVPDSIGAMPLGLLLGFAYLATGVLGFAFFWVSSLISTQLKEIHRLLLMRPVSSEPPQDK